MTRQKPTHCYVSRRPCGCPITFIAYHYDWRDNVAASVSRDIKRGLIVEAISWAEYERLGMELATGTCPICAEMTQGSLFPVAHDG